MTTPTITICPRFQDRTRADHVKSRFQFSGYGTERQGVVYITEKLTADRAADIRRAAVKAAKKMGADALTIHSVGF